MNESRRKEIEGIITRLAAIGLEIGQIRVADAIARTKRDAPLQVCQDSLMETIYLLQAAIK